MRVVTTANKAGLDEYGQRWLDSRKNWPKGTEFWWYTEGYDAAGRQTTDDIVRRDFADLSVFSAWKERYKDYKPPGWAYNVVGYAHKVFAAAHALYDFDGIGVWCDSDCVTYKHIPKGLIERQVDGVYLACYQRTGMWTETGFWVMDCSHPEHRPFLGCVGVVVSE